MLYSIHEHVYHYVVLLSIAVDVDVDVFCSVSLCDRQRTLLPSFIFFNRKRQFLVTAGTHDIFQHNGHEAEVKVHCLSIYIAFPFIFFI